jgi:hypothetical protein
VCWEADRGNPGGVDLVRGRETCDMLRRESGIRSPITADQAARPDPAAGVMAGGFLGVGAPLGLPEGADVPEMRLAP